MSMNRAGRAGMREASGSGGSHPANHAASAGGAPIIPVLTPDGDAIRKMLSSQKITNKDKKYTISKGVHAVKEKISQSLEDLEFGSAESFANINWHASANDKMKVKASYSADNLGSLIFDLRGSAERILPLSSHFAQQ